jgi:hypothetical protein
MRGRYVNCRNETQVWNHNAIFHDELSDLQRHSSCWRRVNLMHDLYPLHNAFGSPSYKKTMQSLKIFS